jgi:hypothetical protein
MVMTPFPNNDGSKENPSILVSADGDTWIEPPGITNPISGLPESAVYVIWLHRNASLHFGRIYLSSSVDGITWTARQLIYEVDENIKGPAIVKVGSTFYIYYSDNLAPMGVFRISCSTIDGVWGSLTECTIDPIPQTSHIEMVYADSRYYIYSDNAGSFGYSDDGLNFTVTEDDVFTGTRPAWCQVRYRGSMVRTATGFDFWYSGRDVNFVWHIGRTAMVPA